LYTGGYGRKHADVISKRNKFAFVGWDACEAITDFNFGKTFLE